MSFEKKKEGREILLWKDGDDDDDDVVDDMTFPAFGTSKKKEKQNPTTDEVKVNNITRYYELCHIIK